MTEDREQYLTECPASYKSSSYNFQVLDYHFSGRLPRFTMNSIAQIHSFFFLLLCAIRLLHQSNPAQFPGHWLYLCDTVPWTVQVQGAAGLTSLQALIELLVHRTPPHTHVLSVLFIIAGPWPGKNTKRYNAKDGTTLTLPRMARPKKHVNTTTLL